MLKKWLPSLIGLSIFAMLGRLLGFVREMLIASSFGATEITDSYLTALLLFDIAIAANASFLQGTFAYSTELKQKNGFENNLYKIGFKIFFIILACAILFYPIAGYVIPMFYSHSPQANETIITSSRLFFILASFLAASGVFAALLQMRGNITNPGRLIIFLNVFSILFLLLFKNNIGIISIPLGFLCGGILFFAYQILLIKKDNPAPTAEGKNSGFCFAGWAAVSFLIYANSLFPSILGLMERYFAYSFTGGTFSHYQYSQKILQLPLTILSFAISTSLLPFQIKSANEGNEEEFNAAVRKGIIISVTTSAFFAIVFYSLAGPVIQLLYMRGEFTSFDLQETSNSLKMLSAGLVPYLLTPIIANIYFSKKAVKKLLSINLFFVVIQAVSLTILSAQMPGIKALTINWVLLAWLNNILLIAYAIKKKLFSFDARTILNIFILFLVSAAIALAGYKFLPEFSNVVVHLLVSGIILFFLFLILCLLLFGSELHKVLHK